MDTLLSPEGGLAGVLVAGFLAATLVPFSSEAVLFGYLKLHPGNAGIAVALATLGNTAGGMTSYLLGRFLPRKELPHLELVRKYGAPALLFAWLPLVGDAFCVAAGWLRVHWLAALVCMAAGRLARYLAVAALAPS
ncbi:MAG TPA: YqaA family protein [Burkholderiales bacterium]|nr:YqaA family protein [Burkholderiales bacterium]